MLARALDERRCKVLREGLHCEIVGRDALSLTLRLSVSGLESLAWPCPSAGHLQWEPANSYRLLAANLVKRSSPKTDMYRLLSRFASCVVRPSAICFRF